MTLSIEQIHLVWAILLFTSFSEPYGQRVTALAIGMLAGAQGISDPRTE